MAFGKTGNQQSLTFGSRIPIAPCGVIVGTPTRSWHNMKRRRRSYTPLHALISIITSLHQCFLMTAWSQWKPALPSSG